MYATHFVFRVSLESRNEAIRWCNLDRDIIACISLYTNLKYWSNPKVKIGKEIG